MSAAEARAEVAAAEELERSGQDFRAERALQRAQVLATIALAEEQRTANLIALFDEEAPEVFRERRSDDIAERGRAVERIKDRWLALADVVAGRLDLA